MKTVELKALEFYHDHIKKRFDRADAIVTGDWTKQLIEVRHKIRDRMKGDRPNPRDLLAIDQLRAEEKRLKKLESRSLSLSMNGEWSALACELEEAAKAPAYARSKQFRKH